MLIWKGDAIVKKIADAEERRMIQACVLCVRFAKQLVGKGQPRRRGKTGRWRGLSPSQAGEPPRKVTGTLQASIDFVVKREPNAIRGFFGVRKGAASDENGNYALALEIGGGKIAPRPYLRPTLALNKGKIKRLLEGK